MIEHLVRKNILTLKPHVTARDEFDGEASVFLNANENPFGSPLPNGQLLNRYPDPFHTELKHKISSVKGLPTPNIFLSNGINEAVDLLFRIFCEPAFDSCIICPPTYGVYEANAQLNNVAIIKIPLLPSFDLDVEAILENSADAKLLFVCSPNNPTGNSFHKDDLELLLEKFNGVVVVDEAFINYSKQTSCVSLLPFFPNLIVLQTFSKAWGLAALRVGIAFASQMVIELLDKVKQPFNINAVSQSLISEAISNIAWVNEHIRKTVALRMMMVEKLSVLKVVEKVYSSDASFVLVKFTDANIVYHKLLEHGIVVRNVSYMLHCENCLRITIGTETENETLIRVLNQIS